MASYKIVWKESARKELKKLQPIAIGKVVANVERLAENPFRSGSRKLKGSQNTYRIRVGRYRVVYSVRASVLTIEVIKIGHRKDIYRSLP